MQTYRNTEIHNDKMTTKSKMQTTTTHTKQDECTRWHNTYNKCNNHKQDKKDNKRERQEDKIDKNAK